MKNTKVKNRIKVLPLSLLNGHGIKPSFKPDNCLEYFGVVNYATNERIIGEIRDRLIDTPGEDICLTVTSPGGNTGTAMSFYDTLRYVLKPNLVTIASGDVDSSGIIIFLTGDVRYVTPHTTLLFHLAGRTFENNQRFTAADIDSMSREDKLKDHQYADLVSSRSNGRLSIEKVLDMMKKNTLCTPEELVAYGLADCVL